jgi:hypothetical protein
MQKPVGLAFIFLLSLSAMNVTGAFQKSSTVLQETLSQLEKTLISYGSLSVAGQIQRFEPREFKDCNISFQLVTPISPDQQGYVPEIKRVSFQLADLDPDEVGLMEGRSGTYVVGFHTKNLKRTIATSYAKESHAFGEAFYSSVNSFVVTDKSAAETVQRTLIKAIKMCK